MDIVELAGGDVKSAGERADGLRLELGLALGLA
jgi:hypothetical protein